MAKALGGKGDKGDTNSTCVEIVKLLTLNGRQNESVCDSTPLGCLPANLSSYRSEELFAAGYGACFQSAMNAVAPSLGVKMPSKPEDSIVEATVHLVGSMQDLDMGLRAELLVRVKGLAKEDLEKVVYKARQVCPYSRATKDNVYTTVRCETM